MYAGRAHHHAGARDAGVAGHDARDPEVRHHGLAPREQDVLRLHVAVDHAPAVGVGQGGRHVAGDAGRVLERQLAFAVQPRAQRLALDVRHHVVENAPLPARVVERQDVRMAELGGDLDLAQEALGAHLERQLGPQHLDGHLAAVLPVRREVDDRHTPGTEFLLDLVAVAEDALDGLDAVGGHEEASPSMMGTGRGEG
jgi:hypothetical protein